MPMLIKCADTFKALKADFPITPMITEEPQLTVSRKKLTEITQAILMPM